MIPKQAIEAAIKGGWNYLGKPLSGMPNSNALDPAFWQALGKGLGNKDEMRCKNPDGSGTENPNCTDPRCEYGGYKDPHRMFERFMEIIWYNGNVEKFWEEIMKKT